MTAHKVGIFCFAVFFLTTTFARAQTQRDNDCPFHVCTPENLKCPSMQLLTDERGCVMCKCKADALSQKKHPCTLHGCTVELLRCQSLRLRTDENGCVLCDCHNPANSTTLPPKVSEGGLPLKEFETSNNRRDCPPLNCTVQQLNCSRLAMNVRTGCRMCRCARGQGQSSNEILVGSINPLDMGNPDFDSEPEQPCPDPREILDDERITRGVNRGRRPLYKLVLKKLRKGFKPGHKYKIQVKARNKSKLFKAVLIDVNPAPPGTYDRRRRKGDSDEDCGAGELMEADGVRIVPRCPTAAVEGDTKLKNKLSIKWIAPYCGCVHIRATLIDYTDRVAFLDDGIAPSSDGTPTPGKVNKPLYKTVCKKKGRNVNKPKRKSRKKVKSWIEKLCCDAAITSSRIHKKGRDRSAVCEKQAKLYGGKWNSYNRYRVIRKACIRKYKQCCIWVTKIMEQNSVMKTTPGSGNRHKGRGGKRTSPARSGVARR